MLTTFALVLALAAPASHQTEQKHPPGWTLERNGDSALIQTYSAEGARLIYACDSVGCGWAILLAPHSCNVGAVILMRVSSSKGAEPIDARCKIADDELSSLAIQDHDRATRLISGAERATFTIPLAEGEGDLTFTTSGFNSARSKMGRK